MAGCLSIEWKTRVDVNHIVDEIDDEAKDAFNRSSIVNYQFLRPWDLVV